MQAETIKQNKFLRNYYPVVVHQMNCILEARMMLDEDLHMLLTFWCPIPYMKNTYLYSTTASAVTAITGAVVSTKLNKLYPLIASLTPAVMGISYKVGILYSIRKYKRNGEMLISLLNELRELNRNVLDYNHKTMTNIAKMSEQGCGLFKRTRSEFLHFAIITLMSVLQKLVASMRSISRIVPITEGDYMYAADWDLKHLIPQGFVGFNEMLHRFDTLTDLAVLIISNFLACLGLTFCVQLWKENSPEFRKIFDDIIPELCSVVGISIQSIKEKFSFISFTLVDSEDELKNRLRSKSNTHSKVPRPLDDFLLNTQILFELSKHLRLLLDQDEPKKVSDVSPALDDVVQQFTKCSDLLDSVLNLQRIVSKQPAISNTEQRFIRASSFLAPVEVHQEDDSAHGLDDEEYSLSIHGSDAEEDMIMPIMDFAEHCSAENLELMLAELKRKLEERKAEKEIASQQVNNVNTDNDVEVDTSEVPAPPSPPPPPPAIPCLPPLDASRRSFLHAVRLMAQNLNREEEFQFGFNMFPEIPRSFNTTFQCYSVAMLPGNERQDVERGGKIIMPPSALEQLTRLNINYPMLFKIFNKKTNRTSHCGVLEFVADEGKVYLPLWLMHNLILDEGDLIQIESVSLPIGTFAKFQPLSPEFLDISNPKAVLENCLRTFACLTNGDVIAVKYNQKVYELCVLETQPGNAISIIECDMNVEFAAPIGYKEAEESKSDEEEMTVDPADLMPEPSGFVAFKGTGNRLDGKRRKDSATSDMPVQKPVYVRGIPDYDYQIGTLRFLRNVIKSSSVDKDENPEFKVFSGKGFSLKRGGI